MRILYIITCFFLVSCVSAPSNPSGDATPFSLEELEKRTFDYFMATLDTTHYQVLDRYPSRTFYSIAGTGFGLASLPIGVERQYLSRQAAAQIALKALKKLSTLPQNETSDASGYKGFYYHFLNLNNAKRFKDVELSSIDTGLLMAGVLTLQSYFSHNNPTEKEIRQLADTIYRKVEWDWMLNKKGLLAHGWKPESGFLPYDWHGYNEAMILLVLAIGSPTHPIPDTCWDNWTKTYRWEAFQGETHLNFGPLFGHQYSQAFIDFRGIQDNFMRQYDSDYFINSRKATYTNRTYCIQNPKNFEGYSENIWGLTACDGPGPGEMKVNGKKVRFEAYSARGASAIYTNDDGTIAPTAAGGSLPFAPEICEPALHAMWTNYYDQLVGEYGFKDAFNLTYVNSQDSTIGWFDKDYISIDQGAILLQIENHRSGLIWSILQNNPYVQEGLKRAGFRKKQDK